MARRLSFMHLGRKTEAPCVSLHFFQHPCKTTHQGINSGGIRIVLGGVSPRRVVSQNGESEAIARSGLRCLLCRRVAPMFRCKVHQNQLRTDLLNYREFIIDRTCAMNLDDRCENVFEASHDPPLRGCSIGIIVSISTSGIHNACASLKESNA